MAAKFGKEDLPVDVLCAVRMQNFLSFQLSKLFRNTVFNVVGDFNFDGFFLEYVHEVTVRTNTKTFCVVFWPHVLMTMKCGYSKLYICM
jgi:hypothetical protein